VITIGQNDSRADIFPEAVECSEKVLKYNNIYSEKGHLIQKRA